MKPDAQQKKPSISDIASRAGVSIATVSRVINASTYVRPELSMRVNDAIESTGYVKLRSTRSATAEEARLIGLMIPDLDNPFFATLAKGIQSVASTRGLDMVLTDSGRDPDSAQTGLRRLAEHGVRALLVVAPEGFKPEGNALVAPGTKEAIPVVYVDRKIHTDTAHYVGSENYQGACNAAAYLYSLGHRDILYLAGGDGLSTDQERYAGFLAGVSGLAVGSGMKPKVNRASSIQQRPLDERTLYEACGFSLDNAYRAVKARLKHGAPFSAVFAADDYMAYGALGALREAGLRVPEDISIVGFDDLPYSSIIGLTTVRQQAFELGVASITLALDLANGRRQGTQSVILSTSLIIRSSCAVNARHC
ncbi:MAG: LacI family DNA-binding transcriptional regulator [Spirochaetia bacterium]|jgi:LacI family transcriptional regulator|nr:LacI family DNA-binding transcriptional regulator [Spirochaetia bacterium]